ncbi:MAG: TIGR02996 domain-containing protein [Planctomycetes bacterium]|nr:TIGR02996 domain-containing protein [Planctomycetota bacterium]
MTEDEPFLRAMLADPADRVSRLVYADWLDDRSDPRGEYARLAARVGELPHGHPERAPLRGRMLGLQPHLPPWWCAIVGGLRATSEEAGERTISSRAEEAARRLGCERVRTDEKGYEVEVCDAATSELTGALAYLQCRSKWHGQVQDIHYHLYLRDAAGFSTTWEPHTYNPYFGCGPKFLEWYGDAVVFIYEEKHSHYIARFGFNDPVKYHRIEDDWILDGREVTFIGYREKEVRRLSVPDLDVLPPLTPEGAAARDLMPEVPPEWLKE